MTLDLGSLANIREPKPAAAPDMPDVEVSVEGGEKPIFDPATGSVSFKTGAGDLVIDFAPKKKPVTKGKFHDNLAITGELELSGVAAQLIREIEEDISSRSEWMDMREQGLELLGLKIEQPRGDVGNSSAPLEGMSTVRAPTLLQACLKGQANARGELLPAMGPVKVIDNSTQGSAKRDEWADVLEQDMNIYLTQRATEYYPDTDRMLFYVFFGGVGFKKVYHCPLRRRPVSESVDAGDLIVNAGATDMRNAKRVTHRITMSESMVKRMQLAGVYADVPLGSTNYAPSPDEQAEARIMGTSADMRPDDMPRTIYECLCERDFGEEDGLHLPYKIVVDKDSMQILEVRRNWDENDPMFMPRNMYVRFPYVEALGFYCIGLLHIVGNTTKAMTAAMREALDAGMFASFPGFLHSLTDQRQETNQFRVPPGGSQAVKTDGQDIRAVIMPLPYKDVTPGLLQLIESLLGMADKLAGAAEIPVGEGMQNAPVGTVLAIIDQATKVIEAVHKRLHAAQAEEFRLLKDRFLEDPEAFWRHNPNGTSNWDKESFVQALNMVDLVPVADPNTPTHTHRLMKVMGLIQLAQQMPQKFNVDAVLQTALRMIGFSNPNEFLVPAGAPPPPDPKMLDLQLRQQELGVKQADVQARAKSDEQKTQMELIKAQIQAKTDQMGLKTKAATDSARLAHDRVKDGAAMASEAFEHIAPPPVANGAGPSGVPGGAG